MAKTIPTPDGPASQPADRRAPTRPADDIWRTALTAIEPNKILVRGYPLDEIMGRLTFGEAIYLLFMGELPSPGIGRLMEAMLVSFIDHGITPPSTLAARKIGIVTHIAAMFLDQRSSTLDARRIGRFTQYCGRRQSGEEFCDNAQILVAYTRHNLVHDVVPVHSLAIEIELDLHVGGSLASERGHFWIT